jgi:hypothetical protein
VPVTWPDWVKVRVQYIACSDPVAVCNVAGWQVVGWTVSGVLETVAPSALAELATVAGGSAGTLAARAVPGAAAIPPPTSSTAANRTARCRPGRLAARAAPGPGLMSDCPRIFSSSLTTICVFRG